MSFYIGREDALLVVDLQNDFLRGGALAVAGGNEILPGVNRLMEFFHRRGGRIVLTQDWHPVDHLSFASQHEGRKPFEAIEGLDGIGPILWPDHCVQGSPGASLAPLLNASLAHLVIRKGIHRRIDSYSTFFENDGKTPTGLAGYLREIGVSRIFLCGLALDYCVFWSAMDGRKKSFEVNVITDLCRGIGTQSSIEALREMTAAGVVFVHAENFSGTG